MPRIYIILCLFILSSCLVPLAPKRDFYERINTQGIKKEGLIGYVYNEKGITLNLWVFSTPRHKNIFFSTNNLTQDSIQMFRNNEEFYLKKMDKRDLDKHFLYIFYNDSIGVYQKEIVRKDKHWYTKNKDNVMKVYLDNKEYIFVGK